MLNGPLLRFMVPGVNPELDAPCSPITNPYHDPSDLEVAAEDAEAEAVGGEKYEGRVMLAVAHGMCH
jgi:hypothetical protein